MGVKAGSEVTDRKRMEVNTEFPYPGVILKGDVFTAEREMLLSAYQPIKQEFIDYPRALKVKSVYDDRPGLREKNGAGGSLRTP
jgi:hypothetical protein